MCLCWWSFFLIFLNLCRWNGVCCPDVCLQIQNDESNGMAMLWFLKSFLLFITNWRHANAHVQDLLNWYFKFGFATFYVYRVRKCSCMSTIGYCQRMTETWTRRGQYFWPGWGRQSEQPASHSGASDQDVEQCGGRNIHGLAPLGDFGRYATMLIFVMLGVCPKRFAPLNLHFWKWYWLKWEYAPKFLSFIFLVSFRFWFWMKWRYSAFFVFFIWSWNLSNLMCGSVQIAVDFPIFVWLSTRIPILSASNSMSKENSHNSNKNLKALQIKHRVQSLNGKIEESPGKKTLHMISTLPFLSKKMKGSENYADVMRKFRNFKFH